MSHRFSGRLLRAVAVICVLAASTALQPASAAAAEPAASPGPAARGPAGSSTPTPATARPAVPATAATARPVAPPPAATSRPVAPPPAATAPAAAPATAATPAATASAASASAGAGAEAAPPRADPPDPSTYDLDSLSLTPPFASEPPRRAAVAPVAPVRPWARPPPPPEPAVSFVGIMGYDIGGTKLVSATLSDGSTPSISASQGVDFSVGVAFLKAFDGRLATQATIGIEGWSIDASNGGVQWLAFPLDVMEFVYVDPFRLGAGITYLISPHLSGSGLAEKIDARFKNSAGLALEADWVSARVGVRRARATFGLRYAWQKLQQTWGGPVIDASSLGFLLGYTG